MSSKLLAQGAYGCVYYPGYSCSSNKTNSQYVSKLSFDGKQTQVEYAMGQLVKKINNYKKRFLIIEKVCNIKNEKINEIKKGCEFIHKNYYSSYVLMYSRYLESKELADVLANKMVSYYKLIQITNTIYNRITELYSVGIIHMDLHFGNILISKKNKRIYVIDFGLALDISQFYIDTKLNMSYLKEKWFPYRTDWPSWSLEYIFISLMMKSNVPLNKQNILATIKKYYKNNTVLSSYLDSNYVSTAYEYYKTFANHSSNENIKTLLNFSNTWDYYKLAYHILSYMRRKSIQFKEFTWLLLLMMHPIPEFRPTKDELKEHFVNYLVEFKEYESIKIHKDRNSVRLQAELSKSIKDL
jgi:thiamine kinase-like enzyme